MPLRTPILATVLTFGLAGGALAAPRRATRPIGDLHYTLVYDADPATCQPLLRAYNHFLHQTLADVMHDGTLPPNKRNKGYSTSYEIFHRADFARYGFRSPSAVVGYLARHPDQFIGDVVYSADLFNDGHTEFVELTTQGQHWPTIATTGAVYAGNTNLDAIVTRRGSSEPNGTDIKPLLPATLGPWFTPNYQQALPNMYPLRSWPHFSELLSQQNGFVPAIVTYQATTQLFIQNGDLFVADQGSFLRWPLNDVSGIIVDAYRLTRNGPVDICYLQASP